MAIKISSGASPYEKHLVSETASGSVVVEKGKKDSMKVTMDTEEIVHPGIIGSQLTLEVGGGQTVNLGNYESARIDVRIRMPCSKDTLEETYEFATEWVGGKLESAIKEAKGK